jgi:hypothetical protein
MHANGPAAGNCIRLPELVMGEGSEVYLKVKGRKVRPGQTASKVKSLVRILAIGKVIKSSDSLLEK